MFYSSFSNTYFFLKQKNTIVGIDVYKEMRKDIDPRKYITVTGPSNLSNQESKIENSCANDDFSKVGDDISPQTWNQLSTATDPTVHASSSSNHGSSNSRTIKKNEAIQKKDTVNEPPKP